MCSVRPRIESKLRKQLRRLQLHEWDRKFARTIASYERAGLILDDALRTVASDHRAGWHMRSQAAKMLAIADDRIVDSLLSQFFTQEDRIELWETALTIETLGHRRAVPPLVRALDDHNPDCRHAAARALGWIPNAGGAAVTALINALTDPGQPQPVREEAAESLAYLGSNRATPALISVLKEPDVRIRFWAVFALGGITNRRTGCHTDPRAVPALESMLGDDERPPGNWWSVGREALGVLGSRNPPHLVYQEKLAHEIRRVLEDANAKPEDRRWAEFYGH